MDQIKRIKKIEQTATDARNTAYKVPHSEVEKLDFVQGVLFFDYCMWQNQNIEVVDDPNGPTDGELGDLLGRYLNNEMSHEEYEAEYDRRFRSNRTPATHDEVGEAIAQNLQNPFDVAKWIEEVAIQ